jgi:RHS repeat-associated protein
MNVAAATRTTFIPDIQGSLIATLDSGSGAVSKAAFLAFGESAAATGSFRYTGQRIDPETNGLYYYRARMYSPALGRFLQADPIGTAGGANFYAYAANDPLNLVDPYGLTPDGPPGNSDLRANILSNIAESQAARASSNFGIYAAREARILAQSAAEEAGAVASNAANALRLSKSLASEAQMGEAGTVMAGQGGRVAFRDAARIAKEYGGNAADWVKKTSSSFTAKDGTQFETHWVENLQTGQRVEFKTKFPGGGE